MRLITGVALFLTAIGIAFGQQQTPTQTPISPTPNITSTSTLAPTDASYLRGQLDSLHSLHDSLISTVHWALGVAFGIAVLLVGYNWLVIGRNLERDKHALRQELMNEIKSAEAAARSSLHDDFSKRSGELSAELSSMASTAARPVEKKLAELASEFTTLRSDLEKQSNETEAKFIHQEALYWKLHGTTNNEFTQYLQLLNLAAPREMDHYIDLALAELARLMQTDVQLWNSDLVKLTGILNEMPSKYSVHVSELKKLAAAKLKTARPA